MRATRCSSERGEQPPPAAWTATEFFVEAGVSGSVPLAGRPEGQRLLAAVVAKGDAIVTPKLDRMFPSASDARSPCWRS